MAVATDPTTLDYVTLGVAVWGALLSSLLGLRQVRRGRPGVKVIVLPMEGQGEDGGGRSYWWVRVHNHRERPVEIESVGIRLKHPKPHGWGTLVHAQVNAKHARSSELPTMLTDGESADFYFKRVGYGYPNVPTVGGFRVRDSAGNTYSGKYRRSSPAALWRTWKLNRLRRKLDLGPVSSIRWPPNGGWSDSD